MTFRLPPLPSWAYPLNDPTIREADMRLPIVDEHRLPFIEPIGHLAMQTAHAEDKLIQLCARVPYDGSPEQMAPGNVAKKLRNWHSKTEEFVEQRLSLILDEDLRNQALDAVRRFDHLRRARHRAVHDAVGVGIMEQDGGYVAQPLMVEYRNDESVYLNVVTPEQIAHLACEMYEVHKDLEHIAYALQHSAPQPSSD